MITSALATYRLTRLITTDEITAPLREAVWDRYPPESSKIGYVLTCNWCTSIWAGSALQVSRIIAPKTTRTIETILAVSAVAGMLTAYEDRNF